MTAPILRSYSRTNIKEFDKMGAITELADKRRNRDSYFCARSLVKKYGEDCPEEVFNEAKG